MQKMKMQTREEVEQKLLDRAGIDEEFRALLLDDPREALRQEFDWEIPDSFEVTVHEEDTHKFHLVIPPSERLTDKDMSTITGGDTSVTINPI